MTSDPDGRTAGSPGIARPTFVPRLARSGDGVSSPNFFARLRIQGHHEAPDPQLAAGDTNHDFAACGQRHQGHVVPRAVLCHGCIPHDRSGHRVERHHPGVQGRHVHLVAEQRSAAVGVVEGDQILGKLVLVSPEQLALPGAKGEQMIVRRGNEHHSVVDDRWGFVATPDSGGERPDRNQVLHVGDVDLIERAVSPPAVIPAIGQPILGLGA